ncbi:hypothetical protein CXB51_010043 [Gossypium anomalum]|uniref:AAA+ ATPase domain-containing protein n=1 Tax=Gossypium anomalum TaxID=47600 RepID=A0A8J6D1R8_9ROSI|nr:hypothetical protein CXB51_010043 [Gossypium anomalum]
MIESAAPAAIKIVADQAKEYASPYFGYFFSYEKIVEDFTNQREALELRKNRVDILVGGAKRQNEIIHDDVDNWLKRAEKELRETQNLKGEIDRVKCFKWCPKWGWRYSLSKKLAEEIPIISELLGISDFAQVGYRRPLQGIEFITSTDFLDSESSKSAFNQIMEAINAKGVNMIGLHGMPGVGKTTLAQEVGKHAREQKLFAKVVIFTMSQNPDINKIQRKVAAMFDLKFQTDIEDTRAEELWVRLKAEKDILIIVDDLWEEFKLERIGIPFGDKHKGCKILLTTRHQQVCTKMNCQKEVQLGILSEDEAWVLFRDQAGLEDDCSILNEVAKEVAGECKGLPLAIVTVAKALKGESLDEWRDANQRFKDSTHLYDEEVFGGVLEPLKLSYDYLKKGNNQMTGNDIQMCFLLCSLFPEDFEVFIEELIMYGIGLGLFPNVYSIEDKRKKIVGALKKLKKSGLLLETDDGETIRMHDVVRDFARWLTSTGENRFMVKDKFKEWPDMDESLECYTAIALWYCSSNIQNFPDKVNISKLKTSFLYGVEEGDDLAVVSSTFLEEMKALQVLYLHNISFSPKGFHSLPNLKTLFCLNCKWEHLSSSLTNMRSLEILSLFGTKIDEISEGLVKLSTLKYLRLSSRRIEERAVEEEEEEMNFPPKLVSRLTSLQELHVPNKNNINLLELNSLSRLTALSLELSTTQFSQKDFVFPKLQRYIIFVNGYMSILKVPNNRKLRIENFSSSLSAFNNLFCNVEKLKLRMVSGLKNIVPSIGKKVLNELTSLKLDSCNDMQFLIDITGDQGSTVAFSNLVELTIRWMVSLKGLCYGPSLSHRAIASFTKLTVVTIGYCPKLKTIFSPCVAHSMLCIEELYIKCCHGLEQVIGFAQEEETTKVEMPILPNHFNDSRLYCCPKLRILKIEYCSSLKYVCANTSTQGLQSLECVDISDCPQLMQIFKMKQNKNGQDVVLMYLKVLSCKSLKYVCANTSTQGLQSLESVKIRDCPQLMQIFKMEQNENGQNVVLPQNHCWPKLKTFWIHDCQLFSCFIVQASLLESLILSNVGIIWKTDMPILSEDCIVVGNHEKVFQVQGEYSFSRIKGLYLWNLFEVRIIWNDFAQVVTLENLTTLELRDCKKLRYIFSSMMARSLSHLMNLSIKGCEEIEQLILANDQISSSSSSNASLQPINFPNLTKITVTNCGNLKSLFPFGFVPILPKLECLKIKRNSKLKQVFELEHERKGVAEEDMKFDKLRKLSLKELPSLIHFCPKGYHFVLSALEDLKVRDCPKLTTSFSIDSQEFVYCETKTPQLVEEDAIEESVTVSNAIFNEDIYWSRQGFNESQLPHLT